MALHARALFASVRLSFCIFAINLFRAKQQIKWQKQGARFLNNSPLRLHSRKEDFQIFSGAATFTTELFQPVVLVGIVCWQGFVCVCACVFVWPMPPTGITAGLNNRMSGGKPSVDPQRYLSWQAKQQIEKERAAALVQRLEQLAQK